MYGMVTLYSASDYSVWLIIAVTAERMFMPRRNRRNGVCDGANPIIIRYETILEAILTCAQKPTQVSLICSTEPETKKRKREKVKKTDMLKSIDKQSGESVKSVLKKKRKATV